MHPLRRLYQAYLAPLTDQWPELVIDHASGIYLYSGDKSYVDLISGISVSSLGHSHPKIVKAIQDQASKALHLMVYGELIHAPQVKLAEKLLSLVPPNLNSVYFVNSGAEATEAAIKLVRKSTKRTELISFLHSYHGSTTGALSLMGDEYYKAAFRPLLPDTRQLRYNHFEDLSFISNKTAAVFVEPIQAESGITIPNILWLQKLDEQCKRHGVLLVADEIQTGLWRTGPFLASEYSGIKPDVVLMAKALGAGLPIGAILSSSILLKEFSSKPILGHITTFGGNPLICAVALAGIQAMEEEGLPDQVLIKGNLLKTELSSICNDKITGHGLFYALHLESAHKASSFLKALLKNGIYSDWFLFAPHAIRICPPFIISEEQINMVKTAFEKSLQELI